MVYHDKFILSESNLKMIALNVSNSKIDEMREFEKKSIFVSSSTYNTFKYCLSFTVFAEYICSFPNFQLCTSILQKPILYLYG